MTTLTKKSMLMVGLASLATVAIDVYSINKPASEHIKTLIIFGIWAIFPYVILLFLIYKSDKYPKASGVAFAGTLILVLFGVSTLIDGFFIHLDAQSGLLFLFIPFWQLIGSCILALIVLLCMLFDLDKTNSYTPSRSKDSTH